MLKDNNHTRKVILCIGDSLGMPRPGVSFKFTWLYKLAQNFNDYLFVNNFKREFTTAGLNSKDSLENYDPTIVILQVGIVDCAPRYFKKEALLPKILNRTPKLLRDVFWQWYKKKRVRKQSNAFVSLRNFEANLEDYFERCVKLNLERLIIIKIQKPGKNMVFKNPLILESVNKYNEILENLCLRYGLSIVDPLNEGKTEHYVADGYHLNEQGFAKVYDVLKNTIGL